jgi:hypothetical protein
MAAIYTEEWIAALFEWVNSQNGISTQVPGGEWCVALEVVGDGLSPYVPHGEARHFFVRIQDGKVVECQERQERVPGKGLQFRFTGPAHIYEGVAAGLVDPVVAGLEGAITVRGDMRLLIQNAELATRIFKKLGENNSTEWPKGKPPYK